MTRPEVEKMDDVQESFEIQTKHSGLNELI